jgi:hypothetical protein
MGVTEKNIRTGAPAAGAVIAVSFAGSDLGSIKAGSLEIEYERKIYKLGDSESFSGFAAAYHELAGGTVKMVLQEFTLANLKIALGLTESVGSSNPATLAFNTQDGYLTPGALVIVASAPRTAALVAQTQTLTIASVVPSIEKLVDKISKLTARELPIEFAVQKAASSGAEWSFSEVNA